MESGERTMSAGLTPRQQEVLRTIKEEQQRRGVPPTLRELGLALGITSSNGVSDALKVLERKGYLVREPRKPRCLHLTAKATGIMSKPGTCATVTAGAAAALRALRRGDAEAAAELLAEVLGE